MWVLTGYAGVLVVDDFGNRMSLADALMRERELVAVTARHQQAVQHHRQAVAAELNAVSRGALSSGVGGASRGLRVHMPAHTSGLRCWWLMLHCLPACCLPQQLRDAVLRQLLATCHYTIEVFRSSNWVWQCMPPLLRDSGPLSWEHLRHCVSHVSGLGLLVPAQVGLQQQPPHEPAALTTLGEVQAQLVSAEAMLGALQRGDLLSGPALLQQLPAFDDTSHV